MNETLNEKGLYIDEDIVFNSVSYDQETSNHFHVHNPSDGVDIFDALYLHPFFKNYESAGHLRKLTSGLINNNKDIQRLISSSSRKIEPWELAALALYAQFKLDIIIYVNTLDRYENFIRIDSVWEAEVGNPSRLESLKEYVAISLLFCNKKIPMRTDQKVNHFMFIEPCDDIRGYSSPYVLGKQFTTLPTEKSSSIPSRAASSLITSNGVAASSLFPSNGLAASSFITSNGTLNQGAAPLLLQPNGNATSFSSSGLNITPAESLQNALLLEGRGLALRTDEGEFYHFDVKNVPADGNCFFHAIGQDPEINVSIDELREIVVRTILADIRFIPIIDHFFSDICRDRNEYCDMMKRDGVHAGTIEALALYVYFKRDFWILNNYISTLVQSVKADMVWTSDLFGNKSLLGEGSHSIITLYNAGPNVTTPYVAATGRVGAAFWHFMYLSRCDKKKHKNPYLFGEREMPLTRSWQQQSATSSAVTYTLSELSQCFGERVIYLRDIQKMMTVSNQTKNSLRLICDRYNITTTDRDEKEDMFARLAPFADGFTDADGFIDGFAADVEEMESEKTDSYEMETEEIETEEMESESPGPVVRLMDDVSQEVEQDKGETPTATLSAAPGSFLQTQFQPNQFKDLFGSEIELTCNAIGKPLLIIFEDITRKRLLRLLQRGKTKTWNHVSNPEKKTKRELYESIKSSSITNLKVLNAEELMELANNDILYLGSRYLSNHYVSTITEGATEA